MSNILIIGDGPLAYEMAALAESAKHTVTTYFYSQHGPQHDHPLAGLPYFMKEMADNVELVVEAIVANREEKWMAIDRINASFVGSEEPILTTTLNASATEVSDWVVYPENVVGWAALPPLASSKVFELMPGLKTNPIMTQKAADFLTSLGREVVEVKDSTGGVLPRVVANLINEAAFTLMQGVADPDDIDKAMQQGTNYPHGPLQWGDIIGLDQVQGILNALAGVYGNRNRPAPLIQQYVKAGFWGKRTERGFYIYGREP